jgi:hypothetical protein
MAAPKGEKELNKLFDEIIVDISENGKSAISALKGKMSTATFYELIKDSEKLNRYARATEMRAEQMADEMLLIADALDNDVNLDEDGIQIINYNIINRDRLRVDSRKWLLSKLHPKKYGDKMDMTSSDESMKPTLNITFKAK